MMTLVLIWLALSVVLGAYVCRLLALSGPDTGQGNPTAITFFGAFGKSPQSPRKPFSRNRAAHSVALSYWRYCTVADETVQFAANEWAEEVYQVRTAILRVSMTSGQVPMAV